MRTIIFCLTLIFISLNTCGQDLQIEEQFPDQMAGNPIRYFFPDTVYSIIESYMHNDSVNTYFVDLIEKDEFIDLRLQKITPNELMDTTDMRFSHISSTNRYCLIHRKAVPIVFNLEKFYSGTFWVTCGEVMRIRLKRIKPGSFVFVGAQIVNYN